MSEDSSIDFMNIDESSEKYSLEKLKAGSLESTAIFQKHLSRYMARSRFWKSRLEIGKKCQNFMRREIFTPGQRSKYLHVDKKWPIEPQEMKPVINALVHQICESVPGAEITYEDDSPPETSAKPEVMQTVLTWVKSRINLERKQRKALKEGLITGYPICLWLDVETGLNVASGASGLKAEVLPWESALPTEWFREDDGSDIEDVIFVKQMSKRDLFKAFPDRVEEFKRHEAKLTNDENYINQLVPLDNESSSVDRRNHLYDLVTQSRFNVQGGHLFVIQSVFPIRKKRRVWINEETLDFHIPPTTWSEFEKERWLQENPEYSLSEELEVTTLWVTTISSDGFVWENGEHWYQEDGELPCKWFVADMVDNLPTGAGEDMLPYILMIAACETEGLSQVRKGGGRTTVVGEGAVKNPGRLNSELASEEGVIIAKKPYQPRDAVMFHNRTPNDTFFQMGDRQRMQLSNVHRINDSILGATHSRQSDKAKQTEIAQGLSTQGSYVENYTNFLLNCESLLCRMVPRVLTEPMVIKIKDEWGQEKEPVEVNQIGFDYTGEAHKVANDLVSARYRAIPVIGDDSKVSRERQMTEFIELLEAVGNQLFQLDPTFLGRVFSTFPNRYAREASQFLAEYGERAQMAHQQELAMDAEKESAKQAQRKDLELEKLRRPKVAFKVSPKDLQEAPEGGKIMYEMMRMFEAERNAKDQADAMAQQQQQQPMGA